MNDYDVYTRALSLMMVVKVIKVVVKYVSLTSVCVRARVCVRVCACARVLCVYACARVCVHVCMCVRACECGEGVKNPETFSVCLFKKKKVNEPPLRV